MSYDYQDWWPRHLEYLKYKSKRCKNINCDSWLFCDICKHRQQEWFEVKDITKKIRFYLCFNCISYVSDVWKTLAYGNRAERAREAGLRFDDPRDNLTEIVNEIASQYGAIEKTLSESIMKELIEVFKEETLKA